MGANLAARAANAVDKQQNNDDRPPTLAQLIERMKPELARVLPNQMSPDRMARIATTLIRQTPALGNCSPESFLGALLTASQLGLEPGPLGEAYLVPYGRTVTFIPGYRGLIKLAWQSGQLRNIDAHVVREADDFEFEYGLNPTLRHKPARTAPGKVTDVYAVATFQNGGSAFVVMSIDDVEKIRKRSRASGNGPWVTDWDAMAKKTAIKQLIRFLPLSTELRTLATAAHLDGTTRDSGTSAAAIDDVVPTYVDGTTDTDALADELNAAAEGGEDPDQLFPGGGSDA